MYLSSRNRFARAEATPAGATRLPRTVVLLGIVSMLTDISSESVSAVLPIYLTMALGMSPFAYGAIDGLYQGVSATVRIAGGWAADRTNHPKWIAAVGYVLSTTSRILLLPAQGFAAILAVMTIDRLGKGLRTAPRDAVIASVAPPVSHGRAFGVHRALDTTGAMLGPLVAFVILALYPYGGGYSAVFVVSTAVGVVAVAVLVMLVPDVPLRRTTTSAVTTTIEDRPLLRSVVVASSMRRLLIAAGLLALTTVSDGFLFLQLSERDGLAMQYFPLLIVGVNVVYLLLAVPLGRVADRLGRTPLFLSGHIALLGAYLAAASSVHGPTATLACLALLGIYYAATDGVLAAIAAQLAPPACRSTAIAGAQTVVAVGRFVSSLAFGWLWSVSGPAPAISTFVVLLAFAIPLAGLILRKLDATAAAR